jgi:DNA-binding NtrC family response regulator
LAATPAHKLRVLFVDDEAPIRMMMGLELPRLGYDVTICESGEAAIAALDKHSFDVVVSDLRMPGKSGWDVVEHLEKVAPETEFVISTGHGNMDEAIQAIRRGAYDFLPKPWQLFDLANVLKKVTDRRNLVNKTIALESRLKQVEGTTNIIGSTPGMKRVHKLIEKVAPTDSTVLILGETGTGKELVARRIHEMSPRHDAPFVAVNCGALPENLVESEFFGHRKGAFTGADSARKGLFEVANGGTLFLDELGELDRTMQVKLLRFLESGEIRRVGENESFIVDVRVVCATHRDLQEMVQKGDFREDLFFRVNTFEIHLPPLRERREDIPAIARFLISRHLKRANIPEDILSPDAAEVLLTHDWSGNIRELANALEHAVILSENDQILPEHLPASVTRKSLKSGSTAGSSFQVPKSKDSKAKKLREIEMEMILHVLDKHNGDKPKAAEELGIALKTLYNKLNQYQAQSHAG